MKQQLENMMYDSLNNQEEVKVFQVGDLESLSASVLYTDHLPKMGPKFFKPMKTDLSWDKPSLDFGNNDTCKPIKIEPIDTIVIPKFENTLKSVSPDTITYPPINQNIPLGNSNRYLERKPSSYKIFEIETPQPLVRLDLNEHHGVEPLHVEFGKKYFPDSVSPGEQSVKYFNHIVNRLQIGKSDLE